MPDTQDRLDRFPVIVRSRPRLPDVEAMLTAPWHDAAASARAETIYQSWIVIAEAGMMADAERCIAEVWSLHRADRLRGLRAWARAQKVPLEPFVVAEPQYPQPGVYHLAWREKDPGRWRRLLIQLGLAKAGGLEGGRFRRLPLGHPSAAKVVLRFPAEVAHWAYLLGQRSEPEDVAVFEKVDDPDPILAVMVNDQWFMVCKWD